MALGCLAAIDWMGFAWDSYCTEGSVWCVIACGFWCSAGDIALLTQGLQPWSEGAHYPRVPDFWEPACHRPNLSQERTIGITEKRLRNADNVGSGLWRDASASFYGRHSPGATT